MLDGVRSRFSDDFGFGFQTTSMLTARDLCKKALPPTAETQTQVFVYFRPQIPPDFTQIPP